MEIKNKQKQQTLLSFVNIFKSFKLDNTQAEWILVTLFKLKYYVLFLYWNTWKIQVMNEWNSNCFKKNNKGVSWIYIKSTMYL